MKIFLLARTDRVSYDETAGAVVVAPTEAAAREYFPSGDWVVDQSKIDAHHVGDALPHVDEGVLLEDFRAG